MPVSPVWKNEALGNASDGNQQKCGVEMPVSENVGPNGVQMCAFPGLSETCVLNDQQRKSLGCDAHVDVILVFQTGQADDVERRGALMKQVNSAPAVLGRSLQA